ncbi:unnamed protein product [Echinostoma caproni]|uniref:Ras-associating domain-containing protein n=1 Tax=Echinostoma caproni TaxID=27848 RepID=A0A183AKH6_9TREM|nr:unnamed protein product [Echinostoma caproni]
MPKSRSRSRSKARTYTVLGNQTVDARSKQLLFNEFEICTMGRTVLKGDEIFTEGMANSLLEKHMKKKKPVGYVNFLIDRMRFGKQSGSGSASHREYLNYREIKQLYTFLSRPNVFMLCVEEEATGKRSYETYMCKNVDDMTRIQELIKQSTSDPQYLLRAANVVAPPMMSSPPATERVTRKSVATQNTNTFTPARPVSTSPIPDHTLPARSFIPNTAYPNFTDHRVTHQQTSPKLPVRTERPVSRPCLSPVHFPPAHQPRQISVQSVEPSRQSQRVVSVRSFSPVFVSTQPHLRLARSPSPFGENENDGHIYRDSRIISTKRPSRLSTMEKPHMRSMSSDPSTVNTWHDDLTYLVPNTASGPELADRGSVYLYVARSKRNETGATNSTDSIPVSYIHV